MTQSSSLSLSLTYADGGTAGKKIEFKEDPNLMCPTLGGVYVDTADRHGVDCGPMQQMGTCL